MTTWFCVAPSGAGHKPSARTHRGGEWLPRALQARRHTLQNALAHMNRQQERLLDVYLAEIIGREEFERKRHELALVVSGLTQHLRQLEAQAQQHFQVAQLASYIESFCRRLQPTLGTLDFAQRRQLVELFIDRVIVNDGGTSAASGLMVWKG